MEEARLQRGDSAQRVHLQFRVPFLSTWGQSVLLIGQGALLGNWDVKKGVKMSCKHEDVLVRQSNMKQLFPCPMHT
jgi:Starch binding domain